MQAALVSIGTELTRGELVNGNAAWLSERLTALGIEVIEHAVVADDSERIGATLARFGREVKLVVVTGGLGPTSDDLTAAAAAALLGVPLERDAHSLARIEARYARAFPNAARPMPAPNRKQADLPRGARALDNDAGTAPGFALAIGGAQCWFLPGVPAEMRHLFERHLEPELIASVARTTHQIHLRSFGLRESEVAERLVDVDLGGALHDPQVTIGYRAHFPEIEVKVLARGTDHADAQARAERVATQIRERMGRYVYGGREDSFAGHVGKLLVARGWKVAVAESCTGGLIGKLLTDAPGSSRYFVLDAVTYANSAKRELLGVPAELLERHGAVSSEVASAMADGALARASADLAVATTGVAGPDGGSPERPVGTVWLALARRGEKTLAVRRQLPGDRDRVRALTAYAALDLLARATLGTLLDTLDASDAAPLVPKPSPTAKPG
jgi:nicotinamide-nucleotide amidase